MSELVAWGARRGGKWSVVLACGVGNVPRVREPAEPVEVLAGLNAMGALAGEAFR